MYDKLANEYKAKAAESREKAADSFESCDTDGFLSQWAHGITAQKFERMAEIEANGGKADFEGLYQGNRRVMAKIISTRFGAVWLLHESESALIAANGGKPFVPLGRWEWRDDSGDLLEKPFCKPSRKEKALGLTERQESAPAYVFTAGNGTGLAGAASVRVMTGRCKESNPLAVWGAGAELKD